MNTRRSEEPAHWIVQCRGCSYLKECRQERAAFVHACAHLAWEHRCDPEIDWRRAMDLMHPVYLTVK